MQCSELPFLTFTLLDSVDLHAIDLHAIAWHDALVKFGHPERLPPPWRGYRAAP
jgi:hypothetical protein